MDAKARLTPLDRPNSYVGRTLSRVGARAAVAGRATYTDDISLPRMLHAAFVRSPHAHARIVRIDTGAAERAPGVVRAMTGAEIAKMCTAPWIGTLTCFPGMKSAPQYPMAVDRACWQGEPVVMVIAQTRALVEDAAELLRQGKRVSRDDVRSFLSGNYCRCTGYHAIVDAVEATLKARGV